MNSTPITIVIFGSTGDLARSKLYSSLFSLFKKGLLPEKFRIVGFSRGELSDVEFQEIVRQSAGEDSTLMAERATYKSGLFETGSAYRDLAEMLFNIDKDAGKCSNKIFYLAVAPKYYKIIFENLANSGLTIPCIDGDGWTRILVEKPFGDNIETARDLDELLGKLFQEDQIFRIDHYLARETMQNILAFRFSNSIFEPIWNSDYVESVEITFFEKDDVGERGAFYDDIGALRDVGQNHLLQMLAIVAMEHPGDLKTDSIRNERARVLKSLKHISKEDLAKYTVRGQYEGFKDAKGVSGDSDMETYFKISAFIDNKRWHGVPFIMEAGKGMKENLVEIKIRFKAPDKCFCPSPHEDHNHQNILSFKIKPNERIEIEFWAKKPGLSPDLEPRDLSFSYSSEDSNTDIVGAYEKVLFDCIMGEQVLFTMSEEVRAAWNFITPIVEGWREGKVSLITYKKGLYFNPKL